MFLGPIESTLTDTANISIHPFGDEVYSLAETPFAHRINLSNLETLNTVTIFLPWNNIIDMIKETHFVLCHITFTPSIIHLYPFKTDCLT